MSAHTPGPWMYYTGTRSIWAEGQRAICVMTGARKTADMERDANARLIAAAPLMLAALRNAVVALAWASEQRPELFGAYDAVNAAIAAANGETFGTPI